MTSGRYGIRVTYASGRKKTVGDHATYADAMSHKIKLMEKTQENDTKYEIVSLERNPNYEKEKK